MGRRIQTVADWLQLPEEKRPHLILFYIQDTDDAGHDYGPRAPETRDAVRRVDSVVQALTEVARQSGLPVNFIFTSDHGMTDIDNQNLLRIPHIDSSDATLSFGGELTHVYVHQSNRVESIYRQLRQQAQGYQVLRKKDLPRRLHYGAGDDRFQRIGDILLVPEWPFVFAKQGNTPDPGAHGYDPYRVKDMRTVFYAWGPAFQIGKVIRSFRNVDVYPIVARILGLHYSENSIDGSPGTARKVLR
jgi:predicted AlkP superfamily pyrophosphatase or phosphodiesterase